MLFTADAHRGLASGAITVTFRHWRRPQVRVGGRYRVGDVWLLVDDLRQVRVAEIGDDDVRRAGFGDRDALLKRLFRGKGSAASSDPSDAPVWRVEFHRAEPDGEPPLAEQADLSTEDVAEITRRLDRLDAASPHGAWTRPTLDLIAEHPGVVSTKLAEMLGAPSRQVFKTDVRKLKRLGLTESLEVGYRLSPRGRAYLATGPEPSRPVR